jgi:PadR family transcriptional regulator PadR
MEPSSRNALPQLRRGVLEFCVLALLAEEERYAYDIVEDLGAMDGLVTSEGTIYPLLSRLRRDELVATQWRESEQGPPRRYYRLTPTGQQALTRFADDWARFRDSVDQLVNPRGTS